MLYQPKIEWCYLEMSRMNLIYLHGFQSSPLSMKGQLSYAYVQQHRPDIQMHLPDLNAPPLAGFGKRLGIDSNVCPMWHWWAAV